MLDSSTGAKNPTLAAANITTLKRWDVVIMAKYISAYLVTVLRIFGLFISWCFDAMSRACTRTNTKIIRSYGADRWINSRNGDIKKGCGMFTKEEREGYLEGCNGFGGIGKTQVIRIQRNIKHLCCWKCALSSGTRGYACTDLDLLQTKQTRKPQHRTAQ